MPNIKTFGGEHFYDTSWIVLVQKKIRQVSDARCPEQDNGIRRITVTVSFCGKSARDSHCTCSSRQSSCFDSQ